MPKHTSKKQKELELRTQTKKCCKCAKFKPFSEYHKGKGRYGISNQCKMCFADYQREYHNRNYNKLKIKRKKYNSSPEVKKRRSSYATQYCKERRASDPLFKAKQNLRKRINDAYTVSFWTKESKNQKVMGCDYETAFKHLESLFKEGMSWDNYGEWHIDHIIPLCSATTVKELESLCHYTNLQPLWAEENILKGGKMPENLDL